MSESEISDPMARGGKLLLSIAIVAASLWDFRIRDIRIFDGMALACIGIFLLTNWEPLRGFLTRRRDSLLLFATIAVYSIVGIALHSHRSSYAILILAFTAFILIGRRDWLMATRQVQWLLAAHVTIFAIQFFAYYLSNTVIDFQSVFGAQSRMTERDFHIRAAGLFQEPNSFCVNAFILGIFATLNRANWMLILVTACAMALSESAWGLGSAFVLLLLDAMSRFRTATNAAKHFLMLACAIAVAFNVHLWLTKEPREAVPLFYIRMLNIATDPSLRERYIQNKCSSTDQHEIANFITASPTSRLIFGEGLSTHFFMECLPLNGFAFLLKSLGLVGLATLLVSFFLALRRLQFDTKLYALIAVGFSFTTYPLATYLIFWIWLPGLIGLLRLRDGEMRGHGSAPS